MTAVDLAPFRVAKTLRWQAHTVFQPGGGVDGDLVADDGARLPLDVWGPVEAAEQGVVGPFSDEGDLGVVVAAPGSTAEAEGLLRAWCAAQLGRGDVVFDPW